MDNKEILEKLTPVFRTVFSQDDLVLNETTSPNDIENWDSLTHMMLIEDIEGVFGFRFKLSDLQSLNDVKSIVSVISSYLAQ